MRTSNRVVERRKKKTPEKCFQIVIESSTLPEKNSVQPLKELMQGEGRLREGSGGEEMVVDKVSENYLL